MVEAGTGPQTAFRIPSHNEASRFKSSQAGIALCEHFLFLWFFSFSVLVGVMFFRRRYPSTWSTMMKKYDLSSSTALDETSMCMSLFNLIP